MASTPTRPQKRPRTATSRIEWGEGGVGWEVRSGPLPSQGTVLRPHVALQRTFLDSANKMLLRLYEATHTQGWQIHRRSVFLHPLTLARPRFPHSRFNAILAVADAAALADVAAYARARGSLGALRSRKSGSDTTTTCDTPTPNATPKPKPTSESKQELEGKRKREPTSTPKTMRTLPRSLAPKAKATPDPANLPSIQNVADDDGDDVFLAVLQSSGRSYRSGCAICLSEDMMGTTCGCGHTEIVVFRPCGHSMCVEPCFLEFVAHHNITLGPIREQQPDGKWTIRVNTPDVRTASGFACPLCRTTVVRCFRAEETRITSKSFLADLDTDGAVEKMEAAAWGTAATAATSDVPSPSA